MRRRVRGSIIILIVTLFSSAGWSGDARALEQALVTDLASHLISITSSFSGTSLLLFGAVDGAEGDIIVTVRGPTRQSVIRRKERVAGIWVNRDAVTFDQVPGYYAVASTEPLHEIATPSFLARAQIGVHNLHFRTTEKVDPESLGDFRRAIVRAKVRGGLYREEIADVSMVSKRLFRTTLEFPANVPVGNYIVQIFLMRDGQIVEAQTRPLFIKKFGIERALFDFAQQQPLIYGIAAVMLALIAGWIASAVFSRP